MKKITFLFFVALGLSLFNEVAHAVSAEPPPYFTFQGRILANDGITPIQDPSVAFTIQIRSPDGLCLLFEETHNRDMRNTSGVFSLVIGLGTNTNTSSLTLAQAFENNTPKTGAASCLYTPQSRDARRLRLSYDNGGGVVTMPTDQTIYSVPYALNSQSLQGLQKDQFLQVNGTSTQAKLDSVLTNTTEVLALAGGTSTQYAHASDLPFSGGTLDLSSGSGVKVPSTPAGNQYAVNKYYVDNHIAGYTYNMAGIAQGQTIVWNAAQSRWDNMSLPTGTMTSVTAGAGLAGGTITSSGTLSLAPVGTAGTYGKVTTDAYGRVTSGSNLTTADLPSAAGDVTGPLGTLTVGKIQNIPVSNVAPTTGQVMTYNGSTSRWEASTVAAAPVTSVAGRTGAVTLSMSDVAGAVSLAQGGTGQSSYTAGQLLVGNNSGALTKTTLTAGSGVSITNGDGSITISAAGSGGTVTQVSVNSPLSVASGTTTPTISMQAGTATGQSLIWNGSSWSASYPNFSQMRGVGASPQFPTTCTAGQTLNYISMTDTFACSNITISSTQVTGLGSGSSLNVSSTSPTNGQVLAFDTTTNKWEPTTPVNAPVSSVNGRTGAIVLTASDVAGTSTAAQGGTGQSTYTAGQILIGNNSNGLSKSTLTAGSGVTITNGDGSITISAAGAGGTVTQVTAAAPLAVATGTSTPALSLQAGTSTGQSMMWNGTAWGSSFQNISNLKSAGLLLQIPTTCTSAQTMVYSSVTDTFGCANVAISNTQVSGLGTAATLNVGTTAGTVAAGDDARLTSALQLTSPLSGGDLGGTLGAPVVNKIQGVSVSNAAPTSGQVITYNSTSLKWEPQTLPTPPISSVSASAPLVASTGVNPNISLAAGSSSGQALRWSGTAWSSGFVNMADLRNSSNAAQFPTTCSAGQTLVYNSGTDAFVCTTIAISKSQVSGLGNAAGLNVGTTTGTVAAGDDSRLTSALQPSSTLSGGDLGGTLAAPVVNKIQGVSISSTAPTVGQALIYNSTTLKWEPQTLATPAINSVTASGPLTASAGANPNISLNAGTSSGQALRWGGSSWTAAYPNLSDLHSTGLLSQIPTTCTVAQAMIYSSVSDTFSCSNIAIAKTQVSGLGTAAALNVGTTAGTVMAGDDSRLTSAIQPATALTGDLSGTLAAPSVVKIQGVAVTTATPTNGQALTYNSTTLKWEPQTLATPVVGTTSGTVAAGNDTRITNSVQYDTGGKLPAVDGSQLTNLPVQSPFGHFEVLNSTPVSPAGKWVVPAGVTRVYVQIWGGGGGGGAGAALTISGGGGGAGGYAADFVTVTPGANITVAVGAAGSAGVSGVNSGTAGNGGTSNFGSISATGGAGGVLNASLTAAGGTGSSGITISGGRGTSGGLLVLGGHGGTAGGGGGSGAGASASSSYVGGDGAAPGGGGGGGGGGALGGSNGGAGATGRIIVWY